jgi:hypothetical protein
MYIYINSRICLHGVHTYRLPTVCIHEFVCMHLYVHAYVLDDKVQNRMRACTQTLFQRTHPYIHIHSCIRKIHKDAVYIHTLHKALAYFDVYLHTHKLFQRIDPRIFKYVLAHILTYIHTYRRYFNAWIRWCRGNFARDVFGMYVCMYVCMT